MKLKTLIDKLKKIIFNPLTFTLCAVTILTLSLSIPVHARNDYLQGDFRQCNKGDVSIESQYSQNESGNRNTYPNSTGNNNYGNNNGDRKSIGVRWTWYLGSNCTDYTQGLIQENMELAQQLELIKMCKRYNNKKLPPQFATLAKKCEGVVDGIEYDHRPPVGAGSYYDEIAEDLKSGKIKRPEENKYYSDDVKAGDGGPATGVPFQDLLKDSRDTKRGKKLIIPSDLDRGTDLLGLPLPYAIPEIEEIIVKDLE